MRPAQDTDVGRDSLAQEIREVLKARGLWAPKDPADLITAVAKAIDDLRVRLVEHGYEWER